MATKTDIEKLVDEINEILEVQTLKPSKFRAWPLPYSAWCLVLPDGEKVEDGFAVVRVLGVTKGEAHDTLQHMLWGMHLVVGAR